MENGERGAGVGVPLKQDPRPNCANPRCAKAFDSLGGGKFFRFSNVSATNHHGVQHYWLCERCSNDFTLASNERQEVLVKPRAKASAA